MRRGGRLWAHVWNYYDSDWGRWMPNRIAPWLFGMMVGSKGRRVK